MARFRADGVAETATGAGIGAILLGGSAPQGCRTVEAAGMPDGDIATFRITHVATGLWETSDCQRDGNTLVRVEYKSSLVGSTFVEFDAGAKIVELVQSAADALDASAPFSLGAVIDVAAATTTAVGGAAGNVVNITAGEAVIEGFTAVTGLGSGVHLRYVTFAVAVTLEHNGTSFILPGNTDLPVRVGDVGVFSTVGTSGDWTLWWFRRRDGTTLDTGMTTIASASTTELGSTVHDQVVVSGDITITRFGSTAAIGVVKDVTFTGTLSITYDATFMILSGGSIDILPGDSIRIRHEGSNHWRLLGLLRAAALPETPKRLAIYLANNFGAL